MSPNALLCLICAFASSSTDAASAPAPLAIDIDIIHRVNSNAASTWVAEASPRFAGWTLARAANIASGARREEAEGAAADYGASDLNVPPDFDPREKWLQCKGTLAHVRDQSDCGGCWAFASTESFNDRRCIATNDTALLSVQDTGACCSGPECMHSNGCVGGFIGAAFDFFVSTGVVSGGDFDDVGKSDTCEPFSLSPCTHNASRVTPGQMPLCPKTEYRMPACVADCPNTRYETAYEQDKRRATSSFKIVRYPLTTAYAELMDHGPIATIITVFQDFVHYKEGVYKHLEGAELGSHAIEVVGWGVEDGEQYWLCKNSWGSNWGMGGFMKIGYGEVGIENSFAAVYVAETETKTETPPPPPQAQAQASFFLDAEAVRPLLGTVLETKEVHAAHTSRPTEAMLEEMGDPADLPESFDARDEWGHRCAVIGNVGSQSSCGDCWAWSATQTYESARCISGKGPDVELSKQDMAECCTGALCGYSQGCVAGTPRAALGWITRGDGIVSGGEYNSSLGCKPYPLAPCSVETRAQDPSNPLPVCHEPKPPPALTCRRSCSNPEGFNGTYEAAKVGGHDTSAVITGLVYRDDNQTHMMQFIKTYGPISVAFQVCSDFPAFDFSNGNVYVKSPTAKVLGGHAVTAIGWGVSADGVPFWLVKNSWSTYWGDRGFFRIRRGTNEAGIEGQAVGVAWSK